MKNRSWRNVDERSLNTEIVVNAKIERFLNLMGKGGWADAIVSISA